MNFQDRFFILYTNNYSDDTLEVETPEHVKILHQRKAISEETVTSNFCERYIYFINVYKANRTTAIFVYTDRQYINQSG